MILPASLKKAMLPLGFLALFGAVWYGLYRPEMAKISRYRKEPLAMRQQMESMIIQLSAFREPTARERSEWIELADEISRRIPRGREITSLYASLSELAERDTLIGLSRQLVSLPDSAQVVETGGVKRMSFGLKLTFQCGYHNLIEFIHDVRGMERLVEITGLEVSRGVPYVTVTLNLKCYYSPES